MMVFETGMIVHLSNSFTVYPVQVYPENWSRHGYLISPNYQ
jgi:hypothetical protein